MVNLLLNFTFTIELLDLYIYCWFMYFCFHMLLHVNLQ